MLSFLDKTLDRVICVFFAFILCQAPQFMQQYELRLAGHAAESQKQMLALETNAHINHTSVDAYIQKLLNQQDQDFVLQGKMMQDMYNRNIALEQALVAMQNASIWTRPFVFLLHLERDIFVATAHSYSYGLSLTIESALYAIIGIGFGIAFYQTLIRLAQATSNRFSKAFRGLSKK